MDRLGFFKQGLSSLIEVAQSVVGLKHAANSFTEAVDEALNDIVTDIGLYLPSLDAGMYVDPQGTIDDIAEMGYTMIEVGAFGAGKIHNLPPTRIKELADNARLKIISAHINKLYERPRIEEGTEQESEARAEEESKARAEARAEEDTAENREFQAKEVPTEAKTIPDPNAEWWSKTLDTVKKLGCRYVVSSRLPDYPTDQTIEEYIAYFNLIGELASQREIQFCYHPTRLELRTRKEQGSIFETIARGCNPEKVHFQIDTREAAEAGIDTIELLKHHKGRVAMLHLHDFGTTCESGKIAFEPIVAEGTRSGVKDIIVEVSSFSLPPKNCVERSLQNLQNLPSIRY